MYKCPDFNSLKLILSVLLEKVRNLDDIIGVHLEYRQKVSKLRGPVKITRTQDYANPTVECVFADGKTEINFSILTL